MEQRAKSELLALICAIADQASANATILENSKPGTFPDSEEEYKMQLYDLAAAVAVLQNELNIDEFDLEFLETHAWMRREYSPLDDYFQSM